MRHSSRESTVYEKFYRSFHSVCRLNNGSGTVFSIELWKLCLVKLRVQIVGSLYTILRPSKQHINQSQRLFRSVKGQEPTPLLMPRQSTRMYMSASQVLRRHLRILPASRVSLRMFLQHHEPSCFPVDNQQQGHQGTQYDHSALSCNQS